MRFRWTCPSRSLLIAAGATAVCCLCASWAFQKPRSKKKKKKKPCRCTCSYADGGGRGTAVGDNEAAASAERQVGGSMMKQLVPEITTHALSYLDYTSLCCLSMTNSAMRRAANDDGVWKAPCHKLDTTLHLLNVPVRDETGTGTEWFKTRLDLTVEQDTINPSNGWKAYKSHCQSECIIL